MRSGIEVDIQYEVGSPSAVLGLVAAGLGHAVVQKSLQSFANKKVRFEALPKKFGLDLTIHLSTRSTVLPLTKTFLETVKTV